MIDVLDFDTEAKSSEGVELEILEPVNNNPTGIMITVVGKDSTHARSYLKDVANDALRRDAKRQARGKKEEVKTVDQLQDQNLSFLAACTTSWRLLDRDDDSNSTTNTIVLGGEELQFTKENIKKLYKKCPWIAPQVDEWIGDYSNFIKDS